MTGGFAALLSWACGVDVVGRGDAEARDASAPPPTPTMAPPPPTNPSCDRSDDDLVLCLPFDGDLASGAAPTLGSTTNPGHAFVPGQSGQALNPQRGFDLKIAHDITWAELAPPTPVTVEAWVKRDERAIGPGKSCVLVKAGEFELCLHGDGKVRCGKDGASAEPPLPIGAWSHVACVFGDVNVRTYVNGALANTKDQARAPTTNEVRIATGGGEGFPGAIDTLRVWKRALSQDEITASAAR